MELYRHFDELIFEANGIFRTNKIARDEVLRMLYWLRQQSLCLEDKRARSDELRSCWRAIESCFEKSKFKDMVAKPDEFWNQVYEFVSYGRFEPIHTPKKTAPKPSPFLNATIEKIFEHMREEASGIGSSPQERLRLRKLIEQIQAQIQLPVAGRDASLIKTLWREAHPNLKKFGILRPFEAEPMKGRILEFLRGSN